MDDTFRPSMREGAPHKPDLSLLFLLASEQKGYFTAKQAHGSGISRALLSHYARSGRFIRMRVGLYRLQDYPSAQHEDVLGAFVAARCAVAPAHVETVAPTTEEKAYADKQGFTVRDTPTPLTGGMSKRDCNIVWIDGVWIDGHKVDVPDAEIQLLLRLVVALHRTDDGYIRLGTEKHDAGLRSEAIAPGRLSTAGRVTCVS